MRQRTGSTSPSSHEGGSGVKSDELRPRNWIFLWGEFGSGPLISDLTDLATCLSFRSFDGFYDQTKFEMDACVFRTGLTRQS